MSQLILFDEVVSGKEIQNLVGEVSPANPQEIPIGNENSNDEEAQDKCYLVYC
jgi:hypothetical protein